MFTLTNCFVQEQSLAPYIMRPLIIFVLSSPLPLATLEFLMHRIHELKIFQSEFHANITT